tara:strand:+ start:1592 stop:2083 length:492 start_codon:yes stop_codon:yes gene_type:complete
MSDVLVTCFSRTGSTELVARALAESLGADLDLIQSPVSYAGPFGLLRGLWQTLIRRGPPVETDRSPGAYALVLVGTPVWAGQPSPPVRSYLTRYGRRIRALAPFCVSGSGQAYPGVFRAVEGLTGLIPRATLSLAEESVRSGASDGRIRQFADSLRSGRTGAP